MSQKSRRHPSVLYLICLIQGCERFAAGAVLSLFALYLTERRGFADSRAILIVGGFLAGSYLASWPSGWLADRWIGALHTARLGSALLCMGYAALWTDSPRLFWPALGLAVIGQGLFRSALATLMGQLYSTGNGAREAGFGMFYVSVNLGYLAGPLCAELVRARSGWPAIFGLATGALVGSLSLLTGGSFRARGTSHLTPSALPPLPRDVERRRLQSLWLLCGVAVVFWMALLQTGTSLTLFAEHHTERRWSLLGFGGEVAPGHFATLHGGLVLVFTPALLWIIARLRTWRLAPSMLGQFTCGLVVMAGAFVLMAGACLFGGDNGRAHIAWLLGCYFLLSLAEVLFSALGMSFVTKIAPPRFASRMAGIWYASIALGQLLAGVLGPLWQRWPHHHYFALIALLCFCAATVLYAASRRLDVSSWRVA